MDQAKLKAYEAIRNNPEELVKAASRKRLQNFARYIQPDLVLEPMHRVYYEVLNRFAHRKIRKLIVSMPPQHGKLLPIDTPVLTTKGWVNHGDLKPGDYVFGQDGKPKKVLNNFGTYDWNVERINFQDGKHILAAKEHLWKVQMQRNQRKYRTEMVLETQQIFEIRNRRSPYIDISPSLEIKDKELPINPYILGCWLGDGHSNQGVLTVGKQDIEHFSKLGQAREVKPGVYRVLIENLSRDLRIAKIINNKHIPIDYLLSSKEQREALLCGLMDTDGTVDNRGNCEFTQMDGKFAHDVHVLLRSLGYKSSYKIYDAKLNGKIVGKKARVCFSPNFNDNIFSLERKRIKLENKITKDRNDKKKLFISSIESHGVVKGNCIEVEGQMYLAGYDLIPTHNSEGSSRKLPAFMEGLNPDLKIGIGSYSATIAQDFNIDVQKIIDTVEYRELFPDTFLNRSNAVTMSNVFKRNSQVIEMVNKKGYVRAVGRGGALTSKSLDVAILDDVFKDYAEGNSPVVRNAAWKWYTTVVRTRLPNDGQELIVFTRWHDDDLIGRLEKSETVINATCWADFENIPDGAWIKLNFEAIKTGEPTELDPRQPGEPLWENKHSKSKLELQKKLDPVQFECLYQGNAGSAEGRLYQPFKTWVEKQDWGTFIRSGNYTDVADEGSDLLVSICYDIYKSKNQVFNEKTKRFEPLLFALITDVLQTDENTDVTTVTVPRMINKNGTQKAWIESNNGGSQFEKTITKKIKATTKAFYQSGNKEARIVTNSAMVNQHIIMPFGWENTFKAFHEHVTTFLRNFDANTHDDAEDCLTGIYEKEIADGNTKPYNQGGGIRLLN